jgi:hypothetical protein
VTDRFAGGNGDEMPNLRSSLVLLALFAAACADPPVTRGFADDPPSATPLPPDPPHAFPPPDVAIDSQRELLVTDRSVIGGARSDNASGSAPWSFRHVMESLAAAGSVDASAFVSDWLKTWQASSTAPSEGSLPLAVRADVQKELVCPWLRLTPENACDETCAQCAAEHLDLSVAPFRLLAIVNRLDLGETTTTCRPEAAEARLVFVALRPGTSTPLSFNAIVEYAVNGTDGSNPAAWHALGSLSGERYATALESLTRSFTDTASLGQLRTSENLAGTSWELRQFVLRSGKLVPTALTNTVKDSLDGTPELAAHLSAHENEIFSGDNAVKGNLVTASSRMPKADFRWSSAGSSPVSLHLFGLNTCNGCHAGERGDTSVLPFAHIGMDTSGETLVSRFLLDDLAFRARSLGRRVTGQCGAAEASYGARNGTPGHGGIPLAGDSAPRVH